MVVDAGRSRSTCHQHDAYIHDHCLRYCYNYALLYQLLNSNLFTHRMLSFKREASSENYGLWVYLLSYYFQIQKIKNKKIPCCNLFTFILVHTSTYLLYLSLSDFILASNREGIDNPFITLGASICLFVQVKLLETCVFLLLDRYHASQLREILISTLLHHPFLFKGKTNTSSRSSRVQES